MLEPTHAYQQIPLGRQIKLLGFMVRAKISFTDKKKLYKMSRGRLLQVFIFMAVQLPSWSQSSSRSAAVSKNESAMKPVERAGTVAVDHEEDDDDDDEKLSQIR